MISNVELLTITLLCLLTLSGFLLTYFLSEKSSSQKKIKVYFLPKLNLLNILLVCVTFVSTVSGATYPHYFFSVSYVLVVLYYFLDTFLSQKQVTVQLLFVSSEIYFRKRTLGVYIKSGWYRKITIVLKNKTWVFNEQIDYFKKPNSYQQSLKSFQGKRVAATLLPLSNTLLELKMNSKQLSFVLSNVYDPSQKIQKRRL